MSALHVPTVEEALRDLHEQWKGVYAYLDSADEVVVLLQQRVNTLQLLVTELEALTPTLLKVQEETGQLRQQLETLQEHTPRVVSKIQGIAKSVEDTTRVAHRQLTFLHQQDAMAAAPDGSAHAVATLLHASVRLTVAVFPVDQLRALVESPEDPYLIEVIRQRWTEWVGELSGYLADILPLLVMLAPCGPQSKVASNYSASVETLRGQAEALAEALLSAQLSGKEADS